MSNDTQETPLIPKEELTWWELDNGFPVFVANVPNIFDSVEAFHDDFYYVVATEKHSEKSGATTTISYSPKIFKVVNTVIGRAIIDASDEVDLLITEEDAWFALPKIPYTLVKKIDSFFRAVYEKHGTESIVLLTFDETKMGDSAGWGFLVPKQENTSADCDYKPESIVDAKPEHVAIVGSAHSHPGMSAYASGTDHKDQATFDGLHITYGWMKSVNNGATEYHVEIQMAGKAFGFLPAQIFGDIPVDVPDEEVLSLVDKVTKKSHATSSYSGGGGGGYSYVNKGAKTKYPDDAPLEKDCLLIGILDSVDESMCPFCETILVAGEKEKRRCLTCHSFLMMPGESLQDLINAREEAAFYTYELDPNTHPPKDIVTWTRADGKNNYDTLYSASVAGELGK